MSGAIDRLAGVPQRVRIASINVNGIRAAIAQRHDRVAGCRGCRHHHAAGGAGDRRRARDRAAGLAARQRRGAREGPRRASRSPAGSQPTAVRRGARATDRSTLPGGGSRRTSTSAASALTVVSAYVPDRRGRHPAAGRQVGCSSTRWRCGWRSSASTDAVRRRHGRPERRAPRVRHPQLEGQRQEGGVPPARARLLRPVPRRGGRTRSPASTGRWGSDSAGSTSDAASTARSTARTRGGRAAARRSTTTPGWRIDYHLATPALAERVTDYRVVRAPSWDTRWSDHAPVIADYTLGALSAVSAARAAGAASVAL